MKRPIVWQRWMAMPAIVAGVVFLGGCGSGDSGGGAAGGPASTEAASPAAVDATEPAMTEVATTEAATTEAAEVAGSDSRPMTDLAADAAAPTLTTEDLEQGRYGLKQVKAAWLMPLLEDLKSRRGADRAEHHGARGPNGEFLDGWIRKIAEELQRRGYAVDNEGNAFNPG